MDGQMDGQTFFKATSWQGGLCNSEMSINQIWNRWDSWKKKNPSIQLSASIFWKIEVDNQAKH